MHNHCIREPSLASLAFVLLDSGVPIGWVSVKVIVMSHRVRDHGRSSEDFNPVVNIFSFLLYSGVHEHICVCVCVCAVRL